MASDFLDYLDKINKSVVPLTYIKEKGYLIKEKFIKRVDYLEIIDKIWRLSWKKKKIIIRIIKVKKEI